jgi:CheY-like chemotaxis protein
MKILIVEDHPSQLKLAHHVLSASGHDVCDAKAAEEALAAIRRERPHLILLDMALPDMDGLALARKLRSDPATRDIAIVAVTSFPEKYTKSDALEAGCDSYILKPLSTRELSSQLDAVVTWNTGKG